MQHDSMLHMQQSMQAQQSQLRDTLGDSLAGSPTSRLAASVILAISLFPIFPASWALLA